MSNKYRVIEKIIDRPFSERLIVANALTEEEAVETFQMCCSIHSEKSFEIEEYNWAPDNNRIGRDPDLH